MNTPEQQHIKQLPWYKQFWPWFLIALPGTVVIASIATFIIAASDPDAVVADNYYKKGLAINQDLSRLEHAEKMGLQATLQIARNGNKFRVYLKMADIKNPGELRLGIFHPTQVKKDQSLSLIQTAPGIYNGTGMTLLPGNWDIIIEPATKASWRIQRRIKISNEVSSYSLTDQAR